MTLQIISHCNLLATIKKSEIASTRNLPESITLTHEVIISLAYYSGDSLITVLSIQSTRFPSYESAKDDVTSLIEESKEIGYMRNVRLNDIIVDDMTKEPSSRKPIVPEIVVATKEKLIT